MATTQHQLVMVLLTAAVLLVNSSVQGQVLTGTAVDLTQASPNIDFIDNAAPAQSWRIIATDLGFRLIDLTGASNVPFLIGAGAPAHSLYVNSDGRIGAGTNNPLANLHLKSPFGNTQASVMLNAGPDAFRMTVEDGFGYWIGDNFTGKIPFAIKNGGTDNEFSLVVGENGQVGIGILDPDPDTKLHLYRQGIINIRMQDNDGTPGDWTIRASGAGFRVIDFQNGGTVPFYISPAAPDDSLYLTSTGDVGFGTDSPKFLGGVAGVGKFFNILAGGATAATGVANGAFQGTLGAQNHFVHLNAPANQRIMRIQTTSGFTGFHALNDNLASYAVPNILMMKMSNGNIGLRVQNPAHPLHLASGAHCTAGGVWTNASSRDLKEDIAPISTEEAREAVRSLQPVGYRYKTDPSEKYVGFIAEDVPDLVATNDRKSLASMDITAVLTRVVQDQDEQQVELKKTVVDQQRVIDEQRQLIQSQQQMLSQLAKRLATVEEKVDLMPTPQR